jgi:hypothetical protein
MAPGVVPWIALASIKALCRPWIGRHIFDDSFRPYCGSTWFGARRQVVAAWWTSFHARGSRLLQPFAHRR